MPYHVMIIAALSLPLGMGLLENLSLPPLPTLSGLYELVWWNFKIEQERLIDKTHRAIPRKTLAYTVWYTTSEGSSAKNCMPLSFITKMMFLLRNWIQTVWIHLGCSSRMPWVGGLYFSQFWRLDPWPEIMALTDSVSSEGCLLAVCSHGRKDERALWGLFYKGTMPVFGVPLSWPNHLPKPTSRYHHTGD